MRPSFEPLIRSAGTPQTDDFSYPHVFPDSSALLQFPDTEVFDAAFFTATLSDTALSLAGGGTFLAASAISAGRANAT